MTFGFGFCSVLYGVQFGFLHILGFAFSSVNSVLGKTWVLVRFEAFLLDLGSFQSLMYTAGLSDLVSPGQLLCGGWDELKKLYHFGASDDCDVLQCCENIPCL